MVPKQKKLSSDFLGGHLSAVRRLQYAFGDRAPSPIALEPRKPELFLEKLNVKRWS